MITLREIADNETHISSTRWAFALVVIFDIVIISATIISYIVAHFLGKPFDSNFVSGVVLLLGIPTGIVTAAKSLQGFERHKDNESEDDNNGKYSE